MVKRFHLAGLMRVRELQEERAAAELAQANRVKTDAQSHADAVSDTLAAQSFPDLAHANAYDAHAENLSAGSPNWQAIVAARASVAAMLRESNQALEIAADGASRATGQWADAKMRSAMIEKLKVRHDSEVQTEALREEQLVLDETALRRSVEVTP